MEAAGIEPASANPLLSGLHVYPIFEFNYCTSDWKDIAVAIPFKFSSLIVGKSDRELVCYDHPALAFARFRSYKHNRWMALCRCLGGGCDFVCEDVVVCSFNSEVAFSIGNYMICNSFLRGFVTSSTCTSSFAIHVETRSPPTGNYSSFKSIQIKTNLADVMHFNRKLQGIHTSLM